MLHFRPVEQIQSVLLKYLSHGGGASRWSKSRWVSVRVEPRIGMLDVDAEMIVMLDVQQIATKFARMILHVGAFQDCDDFRK